MTARRRRTIACLALALAIAVACSWMTSRRDSLRIAPAGASSASSGATAAHAVAHLLAPVGPRRVEGRVTRGGAPVSGARVVATSMRTEALHQSALATITAADGRFVFPALIADQWSLSAYAKDATPGVVRIDLRKPSDATIEIALGECVSAVFGVVRDASGIGLPNARVRRMIGSRPEAEGAMTAADGKYELCVPAGSQLLRVDAGGYGSLLRAVDASSRSEQNFTLAPEAVVAGRVVRSGDGTPVAGVYVWSYSVDDGAQAGAASVGVADAEGRFRLTGIEAGSVGIRAFGEGVTYRPADPLRLAPGQTIEGHRVVVDTTAALSGEILSSAGPVANVRVTARHGDVTSRGVLSDSNGRFVLELVPQGDLVFSVEGFEVESPASFANDRAAGGHVIITAKPKAAIEGQVLYRQRPAAGATVHAGTPTSDVPAVTTDSSGRFTIRNLSPGTYTLAAASDREQAQSELVSVPVGGGSATERVTLALDRRARIRGRVVDADGEPFVRAAVTFQKSDGAEELSTITDGSGAFSIVGFGGGEYLGRVKEAVGPSEWLPLVAGGNFVRVVVEPRATSDDVRIETAARGGPVSGRVVASDESPVADAVVIASHGNGATSLWSTETMQTRADADGRFVLPRLPPGTYSLVVRSSDGEQSFVAGVHPGDRDVVARVERCGAIAGELPGFDGAVTVRARSVTSSTEYVARAEAPTFIIDAVAPGTYRISAGDWPNVNQATVKVTAHVTSHVVLERSTAARVRGRVRDVRTGAAISDIRCFFADGAEEDATQPRSPFTPAEDGSFTVDTPAGGADVVCVGDLIRIADGRAQLSPGGDSTILVATRRDPGRPFARIGASVENASSGLLVIDVRRGGPAARAGLAVGDVIVTVDGQPLASLARRSRLWLLVDRDPGASVAVSVQRSGSPRTMQLTLDGA